VTDKHLFIIAIQETLHSTLPTNYSFCLPVKK